MGRGRVRSGKAVVTRVARASRGRESKTIAKMTRAAGTAVLNLFQSCRVSKRSDAARLRHGRPSNAVETPCANLRGDSSSLREVGNEQKSASG